MTQSDVRQPNSGQASDGSGFRRNEETGATHPVTTSVQQVEVAVLAGGCFWGVEDILREVPGVLDTERLAREPEVRGHAR
jgi:Peptide methionine sulfoxide reductase